MPRDFRLLVFFMNQFPPSPWVYHWGCFKLFWEFAKIFAAQGWPPLSLPPDGKWNKIFNQKNLNNFVGTPLDSRVNIYIHFCLHFNVAAAWYCSHCLPLVSLTPAATVSKTIVKLVAKVAASVVDTGGKFATGINNTSETNGKILCATLTCEYLREFLKNLIQS